MSHTYEIAGSRLEEMLREAVTRQVLLTLSCRTSAGWMAGKSLLLGFDRAGGNLIVACPSETEGTLPELVEGQSIGVAFRRAHRKCVFETAVVGRCTYWNGRANDVPALRLEWPASVFELQRRLYYRTPVPASVQLPVQVRLWENTGEGEKARTCRGRMQNISAGGVGLVLRGEDNPRWRPDTRVACAFVAGEGGAKLDVCGQLRYLQDAPEGGVRMGVQFVGLDTSGEDRRSLDQVLELTRSFQEIERKQLAAAR